MTDQNYQPKPSALQDHELPLPFRRPTMDDLKHVTEHLREHKPELRSLNNWSLVFILVSAGCFIGALVRELMILPYLLSVGMSLYYTHKATNLRRHCENLITIMVITATALGVSDAQLTEMLDAKEEEATA